VATVLVIFLKSNYAKIKANRIRPYVLKVVGLGSDLWTMFSELVAAAPTE